jgi:sugar phosphate isomerase/epimerase
MFQSLDMKLSNPVWKGKNHLDINEILRGGATAFRKKIEEHSLTIFCFEQSLKGALVLGSLDKSTDSWFQGNPEEKVRYGISRIRKTAEAAAALDVSVVNGFIGSPNWGSWFIYPLMNEQIYEEGFQLFLSDGERFFDFFNKYNIKFALEVRPQEHAYNIETAKRLLEVVNYNKAFGFNFDPSHFVWQLIDPVVFIKIFADRIFHCHAKDGELVKENLSTSGCVSTGSWQQSG